MCVCTGVKADVVRMPQIWSIEFLPPRATQDDLKKSNQASKILVSRLNKIVRTSIYCHLDRGPVTHSVNEGELRV